MRTGAVPASTHFSTGVAMSNWLVPTRVCDLEVVAVEFSFFVP